MSTSPPSDPPAGASSAMPDPAGAASAEPPRSAAAGSRLPRWAWIAGAFGAGILVLVALCEAAGWPFLVGPLQSRLSAATDRRIVLGAGPGSDQRVRIGLLGAVKLEAPRLEVGAPSWSKAPYMVASNDARVRLGYGDLWRAYRGGALHIRELRARDLDARLERTADGRASWQFKTTKPPEPETDSPFPSFGELRVSEGKLAYADAVLELDLDAVFSLREGTTVTPAQPASAADRASEPSPTASPPGAPRAGLEFHADGTYQRMPLKVDLFTSGVLDLAGPDARGVTQPVLLDAQVGRARLQFKGEAADPLRLRGLKGRFDLEGRSLADIGQPLGLTLPTTGPFKTQGELLKDGDLWKASFGRTQIGESRLRGNFTLDRKPPVPLLSGQLGGDKLLLSDLAPSVGVAPKQPGNKSTRPEKPDAKSAPRSGRVLPAKRFDLPSLRTMNADVQVDIEHVDLGTSMLEPLRPLKGRLVLREGVLRLSDLDARTAEGRLTGGLQLDGSKEPARWQADLRVVGVRLERWLRAHRGDKAPPYLSGRMDAAFQAAGAGRSTAEILGSLDGALRIHVRDGTISHLVIEGLGLDAAQALGVMVRGDQSLAVNCNVMDIALANGVATPRVFVIDTKDSTIWVDGSMSLRTEVLDLRAVVSPKDFSLLSLRTPIHIDGSLANPKVSLETGKLAGKAGIAALLAFINPIAAVLPFVDTGSSDEAKKEAAKCVEMARSRLPRAAPERSPGAR